MDSASIATLEGSNVIHLSSQTDTKITKVRLYTQRAEITRTCKFKVEAGQNQVHLSGLPRVLDPESLRIEGRGAASIHDVTLTLMDREDAPLTSPELQRLQDKFHIVTKAIQRCKSSRTALDTYIATLHVEHVEPAFLSDVVSSYESTGEDLDKKLIILEKELKDIQRDTEAERDILQSVTATANAMRNNASVGIVAEEETEVQLSFIYAVKQAHWSASYEIRVDMKASTKPVVIKYKANIAQKTGESWDDVPVTLETITPTYGVEVPTLPRWFLSVVKPLAAGSGRGLGGKGLGKGGAMRHRRIFRSDSDDEEDETEWMEEMNTFVTSKGHVSATYRVPGLVSIPPDGNERTFTITQMNLDAAMSWISVPKLDPKAHLTTRIKNASDYTLLPGRASIYVDGSFISRTSLKGASPQETFDLPLGVDPTIRITYHNTIKQTSNSGFYNKSSVHLYTQRISIYNTKPDTVVENLKILERIPVSEDEQISIKLIAPPLSRADASVAGGGTHVQDGVVASWDGGHVDSDDDVKAAGRDGKVTFACKVPAQGKMTLMLQWEVSTLKAVTIVGL